MAIDSVRPLGSALDSVAAGLALLSMFAGVAALALEPPERTPRT